jgi:peptidyl-dipeptidase Dcp
MASSKTDQKSPLEFSNLKHNAIPFDRLKDDMYLPRLKETLHEAKSRIAEIRNNPAEPTFENTIVALETAGEDAELVSSVFYNMLGSNTNDRLQELAREIGPILASHSSDILLDQKLFDRIQILFKNRKNLNLSVEEDRLLEKYRSDFARNGALLSPDKKEELRKLDNELSQLSPQFSEAVLKATNSFTLHLTDEKDLKGLPPSSIAGAREAAKEQNLNGWLFSLQMPSYLPFMQYSENHALREKMYRAFAGRAFGGSPTSPTDNREFILKILRLKQQRARLLGFKDHPHFVLEKRMAENAEQVMTFLERIKSPSLVAARRDVKEVEDFAKAAGAPTPLEAWDFSYWSERLKEHRYNLNQEELRPYFKLENVIAGAFEHARRLYGIEFRESKDYPIYHPDVKTYEVHEEHTGKFVGLFYADFFPRASKNGGAWMTSYFDQGLYQGEVRRPHIAIVCNFTKPTSDQPSLLTFDEVNTLFHEFGHSLHGLLSQCQYRSLSGTNVYWDFVELPSQIMENWILEKESLDLFAVHNETGEKMPAELIAKIKASEQFLSGYFSLRQVTFALLDMAWHMADAEKVTSVEDFEDQVLGPLRVLPKVNGTNTSCSFSHIFAGGYSAGYYSYKWAEVLDADAFEYFREQGLFNREVATRFKEFVLSRGGTEHPMELYKKFRGREPDPDALLRRDGLI